MAETDKSSYAANKLALILKACNMATTKIKTDNFGLVPELFQLLNSVDDLMELANPGKTPGEFHGLPKSATDEFSRVLFTHIDKPDWDFTTWFGEKTSKVKYYVKSLIIQWEEKDSSDKYYKENLLSNLENIDIHTQLIFDEVISNRLEIKEIRAED